MSQDPYELLDVPRDADAALKFLYRQSEGDNPRDQQAFTTLQELLVDSYLPPDALSALFEAAARIPGDHIHRLE